MTCFLVFSSVNAETTSDNYQSLLDELQAESEKKEKSSSDKQIIAILLKGIRDLNGTMILLVDGKEILKTIELYYRENFSGPALINKGGTYAWESIKAMSPLPVS